MSLAETYNELQEKQREKRELTQGFKDELASNTRYIAIQNDMKKLRAEKKAIENDAYAHNMKDYQRLEDLKTDIKSDRELLSDLALNMYLSNETVEVVDEKNQRWIPEFSVRFHKS
ncbi:hypothetical protein A3C17_04545 [Candidatus Uhrbacteria bacterium RIFCSPHIGHO2_02_FULL_53_13]|uniref:Uncharacterized protein n=2 Tax=Candidatus Uhriibacteriota TaxID=1752732 RepID=A0A1F7U1C4_9BACT|nr:MAG: hypothetical protein A3C17_04545 [Candidatus Uhrbacteria bacterium RIFCSPHIGHO2_02_FULL_53_13]OGL88868.1 MAG: hypothetical protein A3I45_01940 [Candidatus Uhrbacteria bacterium RIFCSPLOWO2_02_FULL_53_10]